MSAVLVQGKGACWNNLVLACWGAYLSSVDISQDITFHSFLYFVKVNAICRDHLRVSLLEYMN